MILCVGEALIDLIPDSSGNPAPHVGGAVLNTARALGRLGQNAALLTGVSSDQYGALISEALTESGVATDCIVHSDRPTTLAVVNVSSGNARYEFRDEGSALRDLRFDELPPPPDATRALFFGGISLCNAPVADAIAEYAEAHVGSCLTFLDPNLRPGFANDPEGYVIRLKRMMRVADLVKVSDEDLSVLHPGLSVDNAVQTILSSGPRIVFLTVGAEGARAICANGLVVDVPSPRSKVVDTVGAGDTFNAGVLAKAAELGLLDNPDVDAWSREQISALLTLGTRAASVTVSRAGANPPWTRELTA